MCQMNITEAKKKFVEIIQMLENHEEREIIVARRNKPVVMLTLVPQYDVSRRIGLFKGKIKCPDDIDEMNDEIAELFGV